MNVRQAAAMLECSVTTTYALLRAGRLPHRRVGLGRGAIRVAREDVEAFMQASRVEGAGGDPARTHGPAARRYAGPMPKERHVLKGR